MRLIATVLIVAFSGATVGQDFGGHALFIRTADAGKKKKKQSEIVRKDPTRVHFERIW